MREVLYFCKKKKTNYFSNILMKEFEGNEDGVLLCASHHLSLVFFKFLEHR